MIKESLISKTQALALKELGFAEPVAHGIYYKGNTGVKLGMWTPVNLNGNYNRGKWTSMPTVDEVIDWLRRKHNIVIYNKIEPFVDPADQTHKTILFRFGVKKCDINHLGWNGRLYIGETRFSKNIYSLKREAISIAIKYIMSHEKKKSTKSTTTKK